MLACISAINSYLCCRFIALIMKNTEIKNLLFDLGGVIMDIKRANCVKAFEEMGMADANSLLGEYAQKGVFLELEEGSITPAEFRAEIRKHVSREVTDEEIDSAFCKFLLGIPPHRLQELESLRGRYGIYLLSNTNPIMMESDIKKYFRVCGKEMNDYFDGLSLSYEAKSIKPDAKIFEYTISHLGINPEETLFFDDSSVNLEAAAKFGFKTALVEPGLEFADIIKEKSL